MCVCERVTPEFSVTGGEGKLQVAVPEVVWRIG